MLDDPAKVVRKVLLIIVICFVAIFLRGIFNLYMHGGTFLWMHKDRVRSDDIIVHTTGDLTEKFVIDIFNSSDNGKDGEGGGRRAKDGAVDLAKKREALLKCPAIESVVITRMHSGKIIISVTERRPVARLADSNLVIDGTGIIFHKVEALNHLPIIDGYKINSFVAVPGKDIKVIPMAIATLHLLKILGEPDSVINADIIYSFDLSNRDYLIFYLKNNKKVRFKWDNMMNPSYDEGLKFLKTQLGGLALILQDPRSAEHREIDVIIPNRGHSR